VTDAARTVLVDCDAAAAGAGVAPRDWKDRRAIRTEGPDADLVLNLAAFGGALLKSLSPRSVDLIRLAAYVYRADQLVSRGGGRDAHSAKWRRRLTLCVPVADPAFWAGSGAADHVAAALRFLTDDVWEFAFAQATPELGQIPLTVPSEEVIGRPTSVVLLSGGVDSLCVLLEAAANGGRPVAVSHWSTETHKARQLALLARARERFRPWGFPVLGLPLHGVGADPPDSSQRSRGFLYAALATAVAGELGLRDVFFGDNGPVSINLPINDQLVGALASRSTHPQFLYRFNQLAGALYPAPIAVTNPLRERTRAEALGVLKATNCADLLPLTNSCSKWRGLPAATPHCGGCSQCVDRRFATVAAGLEVHDPASRYRRDVFLDEPANWEADQTAHSYARFAQRVYRMDDAALVAEFSQLYDLPTPDDPDPGATIQRGVDLAKRHSTTTLGVLKTMVDRHRDNLVEGTLPSGCLLRKVVGGSGAPVRQVEASDQPDASAIGTVRTSQTTNREDARTENIFAFGGDLWMVSYGGVARNMRPGVGMTRLAVLLREPGREFTAEEILLIERGTPEGAISQRAAERQGLLPELLDGGGTKLDRRAARSYADVVRELLRELEAARDAGNAAREAAIQEKVDRIGREARSGTGLGGKLRPFASALGRNQDTVYQALHRILPRVARVHPELGRHLKPSVYLRTTFVYAPEGDTTWRVALPPREG
jgi:7-cyano-7-deazaguanine synthase in queuosine biosynthesis